MNIQIHQEFLEGEDPEQDIEELNRNSNKQIYKSIAMNNQNLLSKSKKGDIESKYENIIKKYEKHFNQKKEDNFNENYDKKFIKIIEKENPLLEFSRLQKEVELIEKDLSFYLENKDKYKSIAPIEITFEELNKLKYIMKYITSSNNFEKLKKISEIQAKSGIKINEDKYNLLNKKIYDKLETQLSENLKNIKKLKEENLINYNNIEYELFLTPDNEKMKQFKELDEIIQQINKIENKIGKWNFNNKKNTIGLALDTIKSNMILLDKTAKNEMKKKFDKAKDKLTDIKDNFKEAYDKIDTEKLRDLCSEGVDAKNAEKIICNIIYKMELLKDEHEKSIYLSQKIKELIDKNEGLKGEIDDNIKILDKLQESLQLNTDTMNKNINVIKQKLK